MFYSLTGKIVYTDALSAAIDCGGVAYRVSTSMNTLKKIGGIGETATLYTYLSVREDAMELFGFADNEELNFFKMLISVSGVGPKAAVSILSAVTVQALALCIAAGDVKSITKAQGVGPKIAQRIVLELKDKMSKSVPLHIPAVQLSGTADISGNKAEAASALIALGYSSQEAAGALDKLDGAMSVEELIKQGLKQLSRRI